MEARYYGREILAPQAWYRQKVRIARSAKPTVAFFTSECTKMPRASEGYGL